MTRLTSAQIEQALQAKAGNIAAAARELGVARSTIYRRIEKSAHLRSILVDAREELVDIAESALRREVLSGNITAIIFTLKTLGKERGYVERYQAEHTGIGGGPVRVEVVYSTETPGIISGAAIDEAVEESSA